jgi:AraC-like DNA-binding protein
MANGYSNRDAKPAAPVPFLRKFFELSRTLVRDHGHFLVHVRQSLQGRLRCSSVKGIRHTFTFIAMETMVPQLCFDEVVSSLVYTIHGIAYAVGYSSNQVLARVFLQHQHMSPTDYRRAVRNPVRSKMLQ